MTPPTSTSTTSVPHDGLLHAVGARQVLLGHELCHRGQIGGLLERRRDRGEAGRDVQVPHVQRSGGERDQHERRADGVGQLAGQHQPAPAPAVRRRSRERQGEQPGQQSGDQDRRELRDAARLQVDPDAQREGQRAAPGLRHQLPERDRREPAQVRRGRLRRGSRIRRVARRQAVLGPVGEDLRQLLRLVLEEVMPGLGDDGERGVGAQQVPLAVALLVELGHPVAFPDHAQRVQAAAPV
jgi:hypothetical protein